MANEKYHAAWAQDRQQQPRFEADAWPLRRSDGPQAGDGHLHKAAEFSVYLPQGSTEHAYQRTGPPQEASTRARLRTVRHCHRGDRVQSLMSHVPRRSAGPAERLPLIVQEVDTSAGDYFKHKKGHRKIKACFSL